MCSVPGLIEIMNTLTKEQASTSSAIDILVADDEAPIAHVIAELLNEEGYTVRVCHDGASALLAIQEQHPHLVLLDNAMPVMTGGELLSKLRQNGFGHLPVILMSAGSRLSEFLEQGATDVIPKPFDAERLLERIARYVQPSARRMSAETNTMTRC